MMLAGFLLAAMLWLSYGEENLSDGFYKCPAPCTCTSLPLQDRNPETAAGGRKVVCQRAMSTSAVLQMLSDGLPVDTLHLDLSKNEITRVPKNSFENLKQLLRLDLNNNPLQEIEGGAFLGLDSLEHLDLSGTKLTSLNSSIFDGLPKLQNLSLADGRLSSLPEGSVERLPRLKALNIRSSYLVCDCHLKWLSGWLEVTGVVLDDSVVCSIPSKFKGRSIASLAAGDLNCDFPLELPLFELNPSSMQVVFEGDRLPIECRTLVYSDDEPMNVTWVLERPGDRTTASHNGTTTYTELHLGRVRSTWLLLNPLEGHHSGSWKCEVTTTRGNLSRNIRVFVLTAETPYCRTDTVAGSKGSYHWPKTVARALQSLPCVRGRSTGRRFGDVSVKSATRECDGSGRWREMDATRCGYISETTQFLEHFAKTEATITTLPRLVSHVEQLNDYIRRTDRIKDEVDVLYITQIVERLVKQVAYSSRLADLVVSIISQLMNVDADVLRPAERKDRACNRLVAAVTLIQKNVVAGGEFTNPFTIETENILMHMEPLDEDAGNKGIICIVYEQRTHQDQRKNVTGGRSSAECSTGTNLIKSIPVWKKPRLFVAVEPETVKAVRCGDLLDCGNQSRAVLAVTAYKNNRLFSELDGNEFYIDSEIVSAMIVAEEIGAVNASASVILQVMSGNSSQRRIPAFWNTAANGGYGGWSPIGCEVLNKTDSAVRFTCRRFGHYTLLQDEPTVESPVQLWLQRFFEISPAIYVGSFVLAASALTVITAFIGARNRLKMSRKTCHATCNMCAGLFLLSIVYVMWLPAEQSPLLCSLGAVSLHFLSLSVLVWITIILYKLRKKLTKAMEPLVEAENPVEDEPKAPRSVVTIYLLGWGVAFIVCGISAAISWNSYNKDHCFLAQESSLLMFFIPVGLLLLINTLLLIHSCYITQLHPNIDLPRRGDRQQTTRPDLISSHSSSSFLPTQRASEADELSIGSAIDGEYTANSQLKAISAILLLYLLAWTTGAFAAVLPFPAIPLQEILFPCLYAIAAVSLGAFLFVYCCVGREDIREKLVRCVKDRTKANYDAVRLNIATEQDRQMPASSDNLSCEVATESSSCAWRSSQMNLSEGVGRRSKLDIDSLPSGNSTAPMLPSAVRVPFSNESSPPLPNAFNNTRQRSAAKKYWERKKCKMQRSSERGRRPSIGHQGSSAEECKLIDLTNAKPSAGYSSLNTTAVDRPFSQNKIPHRLSSKRSENLRPCGSESPMQDARDFGEIGSLAPQHVVFRGEFIAGIEAPEGIRTGNHVRTCKSSDHSDSAALPILSGADNPVTSPFVEVSDDGLYDCDRVTFSRQLEPAKRTRDKSKQHHSRTSSVTDDHCGEASCAEVSWNPDPRCHMSSSKSSSQNSKGSRIRSTLLTENAYKRDPLHHKSELHEIKEPMDFERLPIGSRSGKIEHEDRLKPIGRGTRLHRRRMMLSSSEGSLADVWVLQKHHERSGFKKETSV